MPSKVVVLTITCGFGRIGRSIALHPAIFLSELLIRFRKVRRIVPGLFDLDFSLAPFREVRIPVLERDRFPVHNLIHIIVERMPITIAFLSTPTPICVRQACFLGVRFWTLTVTASAACSAGARTNRGGGGTIA